MFGLTHKSLAAYENSPAQCVDHEASTNNVSTSISTFIPLSCTKNRNQPLLLRITAVSKITKYFELLLYQQGRVAMYTLRKKLHKYIIL